MLRTLIIFIVLIASSMSAISQKKDSTFIDIQEDAPSLIIPKRHPTPGRAALYSALLPGAGQFYNKSYIKMPVIYAGIGILVYTISQQRKQYKCLEYAHRLELLQIKPSSLECRGTTYNLQNFNASGLKAKRDGFRKNMELAAIGLSLFYIANIVDAYVDAHLNTFDVNEDLTLRVSPYILADAYQSSIGITLKLRTR